MAKQKFYINPEDHEKCLSAKSGFYDQRGTGTTVATKTHKFTKDLVMKTNEEDALASSKGPRFSFPVK